MKKQAIVHFQNFTEVSHFICRSDFLSSTWSFLWHQPLRSGAKVWQRALEIKGQAYGFRKNLHTALRLGSILSEKPCISSLVALEKHLKRNDRCDRKTQKKMSERERQRGEETRTSLLLLEPQIILIQDNMTTNTYMTQTWWRILSAIGSTLITWAVWLGYMALCMVGEVILGVMRLIFGILVSVFSAAVLIGTFIWLLTF